MLPLIGYNSDTTCNNFVVEISSFFLNAVVSVPLMTWNSISMRTRLMSTSMKTKMTIPNCHVTPVNISANEWRRTLETANKEFSTSYRQVVNEA